MLAWMTTKAAPFGSMIARKEIGKLDTMFFRSLRQSVALFAASGIVLLAGVMLAPRIMPKLNERVVSWPVFLLLLLTALGSHVIQSEAIYLRAHKIEPFLLQSIFIASAIGASVFLSGEHCRCAWRCDRVFPCAWGRREHLCDRNLCEQTSPNGTIQNLYECSIGFEGALSRYLGRIVHL